MIGTTLEGSCPFAAWFLLYYGRPTWKTCNGLVLLTFIFSVGHPTTGQSPLYPLSASFWNAMSIPLCLNICLTISPFQWGFIPRRSTTSDSALCSLTHDWLRQLGNGNKICSVFFDVQKAFDSVPHSHLMSMQTLLSSTLSPNQALDP